MPPNPSLGFFGKLPGFAEFVGLNANGPEVREMHGWIERGIGWAQTQAPDWPAQFASMPGWAFLLAQDTPLRPLSGFAIPSHDKSKRLYPFVAFRFLEAEMQASAFAAVPASLLGYFSDARLFVSQAHEIADANELAARVQALDKALPKTMDLEAFVCNTSMKEFLSGVFDEFECDRKLVVFANLYQTLKPVTHQNMARFGLGLQFPLGRDHTKQLQQVTAWYYLVWKFLKQPKSRFSCFWNSTWPCLVVYVNRPGSRNLASLVTPQMESDYVVRLVSPAGAQTSDSSIGISRDLSSLLAQPDLSLADFSSKFASL